MKTAKVVPAMFLAFLLFSSTAVFAQTEKGKLLLDVDFGLHSSAVELADDFSTEVDHTEFNTDFFAGYLVIDNLAVGAALSVDSRSTDIKNEFFEQKTSDGMLMVGPWARYIFMPENKLRPFVGVLTLVGTDKEEVDGVEIKHGVFSIGLNGGAIYWVNEHIGIDGAFRLSKTSHSADDANVDINPDMDTMQSSLTLGVVFSI